MIVTKGLSHPWGLAFLPGGNILVTERAGRLRLIRDGVLDPKPIAGTPEVYAKQLSGLMDIALHPKFAENKLVYLMFVGSLRVGDLNYTGHLERVVFNDKYEELRRESLLTELRQRVRDVRQGPDGLLTEEDDAALLRIEPWNLTHAGCPGSRCCNILKSSGKALPFDRNRSKLDIYRG